MQNDRKITIPTKRKQLPTLTEPSSKLTLAVANRKTTFAFASAANITSVITSNVNFVEIKIRVGGRVYKK